MATIRVVGSQRLHQDEPSPGRHEVGSVVALIGRGLPQSEWIDVDARDAEMLDAALREAGIEFDREPLDREPTAYRYRRIVP